MMSRKECNDSHFSSCRMVYIQNNNSYDFLRNNCCTPIAMMNKQTIEKKLSIKSVELFSSKVSSSKAGRLVLFEILRMTILWYTNVFGCFLRSLSIGLSKQDATIFKIVMEVVGPIFQQLYIFFQFIQSIT